MLSDLKPTICGKKSGEKCDEKLGRDAEARVVVRKYRGTPPQYPGRQARTPKKKWPPIHVDGFTPTEFDGFAKAIADAWRIPRHSLLGVALYRLRVEAHLTEGNASSTEDEIKFELVRQALKEAWEARMTPQEVGGAVVRPWLDLRSSDQTRWLFATIIAGVEQRLTQSL